MSKFPIFRHYLEDEDDKPYYTMNSLSFYYEDMERKQKLIESLAKSIAGYDIRLTDNLEAIEKEVDARLADWDKQLEQFPDSVEELLTKWSTDGTIDTVIQTALIDEKLAPVNAQLADTSRKLKQEHINILDFQVNQNNDIYVIDNVIEDAIQEAVFYKTPIYFPAGVYEINLTKSLNIPSLIGNNATLHIKGNFPVRFKSNFILSGMNIVSHNVRNSGAPTANTGLFRSDGQVDNILIENTTFDIQSNTRTVGDERAYQAIYFSVVRNVKFRNLKFYGFEEAIGIGKGASNNIHGYDLIFENIERGVYIGGASIGGTTFAENIHFERVRHYNTPTQQTYFKTIIGADTFMLESCRNIYINDVETRNAIERCLYAQRSRDMRLFNFKSINSTDGAYKINGLVRYNDGIDMKTSNIYLENFSYEAGANSRGNMLHFEFAHDIEVNGVKFNGNNTTVSLIHPSKFVENMTIKNVNGNKIKGFICQYGNVSHATNPIGNFPSSFSNIRFENFTIDQFGSNLIHAFESNSELQESAETFIMNNVTLKNIFINNQRQPFGNSLFPDDPSTYGKTNGLLKFGKINGLYIENSFMQGYHAPPNNSAIPIRTSANSRNVSILYNQRIQTTNNLIDKLRLESLFLSGGSKLNYEIINNDKKMVDRGSITAVGLQSATDINLAYVASGELYYLSPGNDEFTVWGVANNGALPQSGEIVVTTSDGKRAVFMQNLTGVTLIEGDTNIFATTSVAGKLAVMVNGQSAIRVRDRREIENNITIKYSFHRTS